jgi:hypothetical protein
MTRVRMPESLVIFWERIVQDLIDRAWDFYEGEW